MSQVKLVWVTPDTDATIAYIARVSNPDGQNKPIGGLLNYMMQHGHVSPFEMASACIEINTTRDIGRQILRHRSFRSKNLAKDTKMFRHLTAAFCASVAYRTKPTDKAAHHALTPR